MKLKQLAFVTKILSLAVLFTIVVVAIIMGLLIKSNIPQKIATNHINNILTNTLNINASFNELKGNLHSTIILNNIECYPKKDATDKILYIKSVDIHYNIFKALLNRNTITKSIETIIINDLTAHIVRDKKGKWQTIDTSSQSNSKTPPSLPLNANIVINNSSVIYTDKKGWQNIPLTAPYQTKINSINGNIKFNSQNMGTISLEGISPMTQSPLKFSGIADLNSFDITLLFEGKNININKIAPYSIPLEGYRDYSGTTDVEGYITNRRYKTPNLTRVWYDINFNLNNVGFHVPYIPQKITSVNGQLNISQGVINSQFLKSLPKYISNKNKNIILSSLQSENFIDEKYLLKRTSQKKRHKLNLQLPSSLNDTLISLIDDPKFSIHFQTTQGLTNDIPFSLTGSMNLNKRWLNIKILPKEFNSNKLETFFPELSVLSLRNNIRTNLHILGKYTSPELTGTISSKYIHCLFTHISDMKASLNLKKDTLTFNVEKGFVKNAPLSNNTVITTLFSSPHIKSNTFLSSFSTQNILPPTITTGNIDLACNIEGNENSVQGNIDILGNNTTLFNQSIDNIQSHIFIDNTNITYKDINIFTNNQVEPIQATANLSNNMLSVLCNGTNIPFKDPFTNSKTTPGRLFLKAFVTFPISQINSPFVIDPKTNGSVSIKINTPSIYDDIFENAELSISGKNSNVTISKLELKQENQLISLQGLYKRNKFKTLKGTIKNIELSTLSNFENLLPSFMTPITGKINSTFTLKEKSPKKYYTTASLSLFNTHILNEYIATLNSQIKISPTNISFEHISAKTNNNHINLYANLKNNKAKLYFKKPSIVHTESIKAIQSLPVKIFGKVNIDGTLNVDTNSFQFSGNLFSPRLKIDTEYLTNLNLNTTFTKYHIHFNPLTTLIKNGKLQINGTLSQTPSKNITYNLSTSAKDVDTNNLTHLYNIIKNASSNNIQDNTLSKHSIETISPFSNKNTITIFSTTQKKETETNFIEHLSLNPKKNILNKNTDIPIINGISNGELSLKGTTPYFPVLKGNINIQDFSLKAFNSNNISFTFNNAPSETHFKVSTTKGTLYNKPFNQLKVSGSFSPNYNLSIHSNYLLHNNNQASNIITGDLLLPLNESIIEHPIDMQINLSKKNTLALPFIFPDIQSVNHNGNLQISVKNSLENPVFNTIKSKKGNLNFVYKNKQYNINASTIHLNNNTLSLSKTKLNYIKEDDSSPTSFPYFNTELSGNMTIEKYNLIKREFILTSSNISAERREVDLENSFLKGIITFNNSYLNGSLILPLNDQPISTLYTANNIRFPKFTSNINISNTDFFIPRVSESEIYPLELDLSLMIGKNVYFNSPIFGNTFFGITSDLEIQKKDDPFKIKGSTLETEISNQFTIGRGSFFLLNKRFELISEVKQQIYASQSQTPILKNTIGLNNEIDKNKLTIISPELSIKALCVIENDQTSTENISLPYTHIVMTINDSLYSLNEIIFEVYESPVDTPLNISEVSFIKQFSITNSSSELLLNNEKNELSDLINILIPELSQFDNSNNEVLSSLGESQINTLIRRSILRPFEKKLAKQVGLNDIKINYDVGEQIIKGNSDSIGIDLIKHLISERLILRLSTQTHVTDTSQANEESGVELSEIELSYYLLKNKNLSVNYNNYKHATKENTYQSKLSMRYDYDY